MFDREHGIGLPTMQGNQASSRGEGEVSWFFSSCGGNLKYILKVHLGLPFKTRVCSVMSGLLSSYERHHRNLYEAWQGNRDVSRGKAGLEGPFLVATVILGFLSIFKKSQASSPFEALNSVFLSRCPRDVRPPVQIRRRPRVSLGSPQRMQTSFHLLDERRECIQATAGKSSLLFSQGIFLSIPLKAANSGSLSHSYWGGKPPLEVLVESWHNTSVKARESARISR